MGEGDTQLSKKFESAVNRALARANESKHRQFKHCSIVMNSSGIVSIAVNEQFKTAVMPNKKYGLKDKPHAEMRAVHYAGTKAKGSTLISIRANLANSKPCSGCMEEIRKFGIKRLIYVDKLGNFIVEKVK